MRVILTMISVLAAMSMAMAQANTTKTPTPAQGAQGAAAPAPAGPHQPMAKTKEEYDAYVLANSKTDPAQAEAAADEYAQKFPTSELKELLYGHAMNLYQQQNNSAKVIVVGRKLIEMNPTNPVPLVAVASALAMDTRDNDMDRDARYAEASKDAQAAIDNMDIGLQVPPNTPPERVTAAKSNLSSIAYDTLGVIAINKKDYASAEQNFQKAADLMKDQPDAVVYLRLSVAQDNEKKYEAALASANKAAQYAPDGSAEKNLAKQQQDRLQKLLADKSAPSSAPATTAPATPPPATTPH
jgi:tetratricopeptide (TPR) repeat protein